MENVHLGFLLDSDGEGVPNAVTHILLFLTRLEPDIYQQISVADLDSFLRFDYGFLFSLR